MINALHKFYLARPRFVYAIALGAVIGVAVPLRDNDWLMRTLIGWNSASYLFLIFIWTMMIRADDEDVKRIAQRQDENAFIVLVAISFAAIMSLIAIVFELANVGSGSAARSFHIAMTASTVISSWFLIPTIFGLHYAHEYYRARRGECTLDFPDKKLEPDYWDFMYFSFTIAAASQTSDVEIVARGMRKAALAQTVMSFFFNASILALSINISASLVAG